MCPLRHAAMSTFADLCPVRRAGRPWLSVPVSRSSQSGRRKTDIEPTCWQEVVEVYKVVGFQAYNLQSRISKEFWLLQRGPDQRKPREAIPGGGAGWELSTGVGDKTHSHLIIGKGAHRGDGQKQVHTQLSNYTQGKVKRILVLFYHKEIQMHGFQKKKKRTKHLKCKP